MHFVFLALTVASFKVSQKVSPVQKVIELLDELKAKVPHAGLSSRQFAWSWGC